MVKPPRTIGKEDNREEMEMGYKENGNLVTCVTWLTTGVVLAVLVVGAIKLINFLLGIL